MTEKKPNPEVLEKKVRKLYKVIYPEYDDDIYLYEVTRSDVEAEILLPQVGINFELWQEWPAEKRLEVLLHEFAHTENYEDDHSPEFWERVVRLVAEVSDNKKKIESILGEDINLSKLKKIIIRSVHVDVVEENKSVQKQKRTLQKKLLKQEDEVYEI